MRKLLFTLAFAVIGVTASYAQKNERVKLSPEERADKIAAAMQTKLSLNDDQKSKIRQIELDRIKQQDELRKTDAAAMKGKFEERKAAMKAHDEKIKGVLTSEQQKVYAASKEEMKGKLKDRMRERKGRPHKAPKVEEGTGNND
jgi:DNA-binding protein H-NS